MYDSVVEVKRVAEVTIAVTADNISEKSEVEEVPDEMMPQPYEEFASVIKTQPQPEYATPERTLKVFTSGNKRVSMPPKMPEDYSSLYEDKRETTRNSMRLLPEGMYSSIGDICAPPLPPPLATEHIPIEIRKSLENMAEREAKQAKESGSQAKLSGIDVTNSHTANEQNPAAGEAIHEIEKVGSIDMTDGDTPFYTNVTLQQIDRHSSKDKLNTRESEVEYYNTREKLFATHEDEVEIKQDLYVNF